VFDIEMQVENKLVYPMLVRLPDYGKHLWLNVCAKPGSIAKKVYAIALAMWDCESNSQKNSLGGMFGISSSFPIYCVQLFLGHSILCLEKMISKIRKGAAMGSIPGSVQRIKTSAQNNLKAKFDALYGGERKIDVLYKELEKFTKQSGFTEEDLSVEEKEKVSYVRKLQAV
jgi:hypothetical protein